MADDPTPEENEADESGPIKQIRDQLKAEQKARKELEDKLNRVEPQFKGLLLNQVGIDPDSDQAQGLLTLHDGEMTVDALKETANRFGFRLGESEEAPPQQQLGAEQQQAIASQERSDQVFGKGSPAQPPQTMEGRLEAAEAKANETGDWSEWDRLQVEASLSR